VFTLFAILSVVDAARVKSRSFSKTSGFCGPVMAKWVCGPGAEAEMECARELCLSEKMANYNGKGPHPLRDACCNIVGEAIPGLEPEPVVQRQSQSQIQEPLPVVIEPVVTEPVVTEPVFQPLEFEILPGEQDKTLEKAFIATVKAPMMSWGMSCIALCEAENVEESFDSGCQAIQSEEDCEKAQIASDFTKFVSPSNPNAKSVFAKKYPPGCLVPEGKDYVLWNPPSEARPRVGLTNVCGRYS